MKPDFALSLYADGICLLERAGTGWLVLGEINLSDDEFDANMYIEKIGQERVYPTLVKNEVWDEE